MKKTTKSNATSKSKDTKLTAYDAGLEGPTGRFWTMRIEPKGTALLSQNLMPCTFVIKNHGPNNIRFVSHCGHQSDLSPGGVCATWAADEVTVENTGEKPVLIEFEFVYGYLIK